MREIRILFAGLFLLSGILFTCFAETIVLGALSGDGPGPIGWNAGGATLGDDAMDSGGTVSSYTGKVPNKRFFVDIADTTLSSDDIIYSVSVRVRAKADTNMNGTYDGIRLAIKLAGSEYRDAVIFELDTAYNYYKREWAKNPVSALPWTWADVCGLTAGVFTAKRQQLTFATFEVDHIQVVVTYGNGADKTPPVATSVAITGTPIVGQTLTGNYVYSDKENDPEGTSLFQWYRAVGTGPNDDIAVITGATAQSCLLGLLEIGQYISFGVVPVATNEIFAGSEAVSAFAGPVADISVAVRTPVYAAKRDNSCIAGTYDLKGRIVKQTSSAKLSKTGFLITRKTNKAGQYSKVTVVK